MMIVCNRKALQKNILIKKGINAKLSLIISFFACFLLLFPLPPETHLQLSLPLLYIFLSPLVLPLLTLCLLFPLLVTATFLHPISSSFFHPIHIFYSSSDLYSVLILINVKSLKLDSIRLALSHEDKHRNSVLDRLALLTTKCRIPVSPRNSAKTRLEDAGKIGKRKERKKLRVPRRKVNRGVRSEAQRARPATSQQVYLPFISKCHALKQNPRSANTAAADIFPPRFAEKSRDSPKRCYSVAADGRVFLHLEVKHTVRIKKYFLELI